MDAQILFENNYIDIPCYYLYSVVTNYANERMGSRLNI